MKYEHILFGLNAVSANVRVGEI